MTIQTLTVVGVGLLGGSLGLAARQRGLARRVLGCDRDPASLDFARDLGAIDSGCLALEDAVREAEVVVFCTPVDQIARQVLAAAEACAAGALLTDVGSAKAAIVRAVDGRLPAGVAFVGSHPLAGSEKRGPEHANARLFERRLAVVTPTPRTDAAALQRTRALWEGLGSRVHMMSPEDHDRALALTSHLPHLTAAALAGILPPELYELTATGFRDTTRVAAGDPGLWTAIFAQNRAAVLDGLRLLAARLGEFRQALEAGDDAALDRLLTQAKKVRDALGNCDLPQRA
jgi:cyclohexadieny/prephenate dehydrogenase